MPTHIWARFFITYPKFFSSASPVCCFIILTLLDTKVVLCYMLSFNFSSNNRIIVILKFFPTTTETFIWFKDTEWPIIDTPTCTSVHHLAYSKLTERKYVGLAHTRTHYVRWFWYFDTVKVKKRWRKQNRFKQAIWRNQLPKGPCSFSFVRVRPCYWWLFTANTRQSHSYFIINLL
jgi:hypothetical protein